MGSSVFCLYQKLPTLTDSLRDAGILLPRVKHTHTAPTVDKMTVILIHQTGQILCFQIKSIIFFKLCHNLCSQFCSADAHTRQQIQGGSCRSHFLRKNFIGNVDSHADHNIVDIIDLCAHLCQNATYFFAVTYDIVRPFDLCVNSNHIFNARPDRKCHHKGQHRSISRLNIRFKNTFAGFGIPGTSPASFSRSLTIAEHQQTVLCTFFCQPFCLIVGRIGLIKHHQMLSRPVCFQIFLKLFFRQQIRFFF